jgi:beta-N-acetylhexosaminidase
MIPDSVAMLAGQALVVGFPEGPPPSELIQAARRGELGGFILFRRNLGSVAEVAELTGALARAFPDDLPPFIGVDQEGGRVARLGPPVLTLPPMRALGDVDDPALTRDAAELLGRQLALLGFNVDFAPVLDVDTNPDNPVIGDRAFGRDVDTVVRHGRAFAAGLEAGGVAACGKHFPGHGDTDLDSHLALPRLTHGPERLQRVELSPFAQLAAELPAIMTAHIVYAALDPQRPATLSPAVVTDLLRGELGYDGVVFSDDLEMGAIAERHGPGEAACEAIAAGCDVALICSRPEGFVDAHRALCARADADATFARRLRQAAARSLRLRRRHRPVDLTPAQLQARLANLSVQKMEERIAAAIEARGAIRS